MNLWLNIKKISGVIEWYFIYTWGYILLCSAFYILGKIEIKDKEQIWKILTLYQGKIIIFALLSELLFLLISLKFEKNKIAEIARSLKVCLLISAPVGALLVSLFLD